MSDDANVQGVAVRVVSSPPLHVGHNFCEVSPSNATHVAHSLSDEAQAARRDVAMDEMDEATPAEAQAFLRGVLATLRVLGLDSAGDRILRVGLHAETVGAGEDGADRTPEAPAPTHCPCCGSDTRVTDYATRREAVVSILMGGIDQTYLPRTADAILRTLGLST